MADPLGNITTYRYDTSYRVTSIDNAYGRRISYAYDAAENVVRVDDARKPGVNTTTFTYSARGNVLSRTNGLGKLQSFTYTATNHLATATDSLGRTTTYAYDPRGNPVSITAANGDVSRIEYDIAGQPTAAIDGRGKRTSLTHDPAGNLVATTDATGRTTTASYDVIGRVTARTDPLGHSTTFAYDDADQLTSSRTPVGSTTSWSYDPAGNVVVVTDPKGQPTTSEYDAKNRTVSLTDASGAITRFTYDANDNRLAVTDANNHTNTSTYDKLNRLATSADALANRSLYDYDGAGNLTKRTDANGVVSTSTYDLIDRRLSTTSPSQTLTFTYDAADQLTSMADGTGTTSYALDALGRPTSITFPAAKVVAYRYDQAGNRVGLTYPDGKLVAYGYDDANRMTMVTDWAGRVTSYDYDPAGRRASTTLPNGVVDTASYDDAGSLLATVSALPGQSPVASATYTLDAAANRAAMTTLDGPSSYTYDATDRLTGVAYPDGGSEAFAYDPAGRRSTMTNTTPGGVLTTTAYTYDNADRMTAAGATSYSYDANGDRISAGADTYGWDAENRLRTATVGGVSSVSTYRGDGLRASTTTAGVTTTATWDLAAELPLVLQEGTRSYLWGLSLIAQHDGAAIQYLSSDGLGTTTALTDGTGATVGRFAYNAFGSLRATSGTASSAFGFAGQQSDTATGLQYLRARYYEPATGQFLSRDPIEAVTREAYGYTGGNPVNRVDPTGMNWLSDRASDIGGAIVSGADTVREAAQDTGEFVVRNRGTIATIGAAGTCLIPAVGLAGCGYAAATAFGVRAEQRVQEQGLTNSLRTNLTDAGLTYLTFGLGGAFEALAGAWRGVAGFGALAKSGSLGYFGRLIPAGYDVTNLFGYLREKAGC